MSRPIDAPSRDPALGHGSARIGAYEFRRLVNGNRPAKAVDVFQEPRPTK